MIVLPIVERELRVAAKRTTTYRGRFYTALVVAAIGAYLLWISSVIGGGGSAIFTMVTVCIAVFAVASGWASYDGISQEKRDGTIGFLFLTDLRGRDIVLGKLAASALPSIYAALGVFPVLAIAMLMGGLSAREFWETSLAVLNLFFLSHAAAMLGSALFRDRRNAAGFPALVALGYMIESALSAIAEAYHWHGTSLALQAINPAHTLIVGVLPAVPRSTAPYGISLGAVHLTGWLFVGLASWALPYRWQEKPRRPNPLRAWWERLRFGSLAARAKLRRRLIGANPFFWLVSRRQSGPASIWAAFGTVAAFLVSLAVWAVKKEHNRWSDVFPGIFIFATVIFQFALKVMICGAACRSLQTERANGGMETLLCCTPLSTGEIISGLWLAMRRWLMGPALAVLLLGVGMIASAWKSQGRDDDIVQLIWFLAAATLVLAPDMMALGWVAMWMEMSQPKARGSANIVGAVICVCGLPWVIIGAAYTTLAYTRIMKEPPPVWIPWMILSLILDVGLCAISSRQLLKNFRKWAVPSYDPPLTLWGRLGRFSGKIARNLRLNKLVD